MFFVGAQFMAPSIGRDESRPYNLLPRMAAIYEIILIVEGGMGLRFPALHLLHLLEYVGKKVGRV